jgi:hypothetical protein
MAETLHGSVYESPARAFTAGGKTAARFESHLPRANERMVSCIVEAKSAR